MDSVSTVLGTNHFISDHNDERMAKFLQKWQSYCENWYSTVLPYDTIRIRYV